MVECKVMTERGSDASKGYAFVTYYERSDAETAVAALDQQLYHGRSLNVRFAEPPASTAGGGVPRPPARQHVNIPISGVSGNKLFVGGLPFTATDAEIREMRVP